MYLGGRRGRLFGDEFNHGYGPADAITSIDISEMGPG